MEEAFFHTHAYLLEHTNATVRRNLMDERGHVAWARQPFSFSMPRKNSAPVTANVCM